MIVCGNRKALIGGQFGSWKIKREPAKEDFDFIDHFFDRDSPEPAKDKGKGDETVKFTGEIKLVDFNQFVGFLNSISYQI